MGEGDNAMFHNILTLNNGIKIPQLGLGTWFIHDDIVVDAIKEAVNVGYRHFDKRCLLNYRPVPPGCLTSTSLLQ